jgi:hypothetical protein
MCRGLLYLPLERNVIRVFQKTLASSAFCVFFDQGIYCTGCSDTLDPACTAETTVSIHAIYASLESKFSRGYILKYRLRQKKRPYLITHRVFTRFLKSWYRLLATLFTYLETKKNLFRSPNIRDMDDPVKGTQLAFFARGWGAGRWLESRKIVFWAHFRTIGLILSRHFIPIAFPKIWAQLP